MYSVSETFSSSRITLKIRFELIQFLFLVEKMDYALSK